MDKSKLLDQCGALGEDRTLLARVLDRAKQASERNIPAATDFLSPAQQAQAADLLHAAGIPETAYIRWGGYDGAERAVLLFLPDWMDPSDAGTYSPIRCLRAAFRKEENLTHRDFLGSLMGMGIVREKIGDILVGPDSADVLVLDTVAEFLAQSWESAGRVKLRVAEIDPGCVHIPEIRREERRDTVSSLRLDAVLSAMLHVSRGTAAGLIEAGRVEINHLPVEKPHVPVYEQDVFTVRGKGRFRLTALPGKSKKDRSIIEFFQY